MSELEKCQRDGASVDESQPDRCSGTPTRSIDLPGQVNALDVFSLFVVSFGFGLAAVFGGVYLIRTYL